MYEFNISLTEQDYLQFNMFWLKKSHYGRKQWIGMRFMPVVVFVLFAIATFIDLGLTGTYFVNLFFLSLLCGLLELLIPPFVTFIYKQNIKSMKKTGKPAYSVEAVMEFSDDVFSEVTADRKAEHIYSAVEKVNILKNKYVYIHVSSHMAYVIPMSSFVSETQYNDFIGFLKSKNISVEVFS